MQLTITIPEAYKQPLAKNAAKKKLSAEDYLLSLVIRQLKLVKPAKPDHTIDTIQRFINKTAGCWEWTGALSGTGYGRIRKGKKYILAHRFIYSQTIGPIPEGMHICHKCDNPKCVNPDHLFLGTAKDNILDKHKKLRGGVYKLTPEQIRTIRSEYVPYKTPARIFAERYGVRTQQIQKILWGQAWNWFE